MAATTWASYLARGMSTAATRPTWHQTMLRIRDPSVTVPFYENNFGMTLLDRLDFPQWEFSLYFMASVPDSEKASLPTPGTPEARENLWKYRGTTLELTHNHGTEADETSPYHAGNTDGHGFGHIAFNTDDVYAASAELEAKGVAFRKRPDEGRMKGLAFALDPDGYWVEIVSRLQGQTTIAERFNFSQTMIRVKDPAPSLAFYRDIFGMTLVSEKHFGPGRGDFSLYFLTTLTDKQQAGALPDPTSDEANAFCKQLWQPVLELTHNHGTETQEEFKHENGNDAATGKGFGHIGFLVDDVYAVEEQVKAAGFQMQKEADGGGMKGLAFARDPDGYWVEVIKRGGYERSGGDPYWTEETKG